VQGIGGADDPGSLAIITTYFDPDQRGGAIGMWSAATTIVTVVGPVLGGLLADAGLCGSSINLPWSSPTLLILYFKVPESRAEEVSGQIDYPGAVLRCSGQLDLLGFISCLTSDSATRASMGR